MKNLKNSALKLSLDKHIQIHDLLKKINSFINYKNPRKDNVFEMESNWSCLKYLDYFRKDGFEEVEEEKILNILNSKGSVEKRKLKILKIWGEV
jgi:hypothetical protein